MTKLNSRLDTATVKPNIDNTIDEMKQLILELREECQKLKALAQRTEDDRKQAEMISKVIEAQWEAKRRKL